MYAATVSSNYFKSKLPPQEIELIETHPVPAIMDYLFFRHMVGVGCIVAGVRQSGS